jgi:hypothetical protein
MSSDFLKLRLRAQEQEFSRQRDLNAYKTIRDNLKSSGQLEVRVPPARAGVRAACPQRRWLCA